MKITDTNDHWKQSIATCRVPTSLHLVNASIRPASVCIYARRRRAERDELGRETPM